MLVKLCVSLIQARVTWEEGIATEKISLYDSLLGKSVGQFLISDGCGMVQLIRGGASPGQIILSCTRKQAEELERLLLGEKQCLLLWRTQVMFPAPVWC